MIIAGTYVSVADNSGAKRLKVINKLGKSKYNAASLGDVVIAATKIAAPRSNVTKKEVVRAVVVRQTSKTKRPDGTSIRFDDNAVVIINPDGLPRATRILGPVARELRDRGYSKIISLAQEVI